MPIIQTPKELGLTIRSRRKELGWDQATLAKQVGVTRQWVIEIEKGKPRAEVGLALRALRVLGLSLNVDAKQEASAAPGDKRSEHPASGDAPNLDIDAIVERNRGAAVGGTAVLPSAIAGYLEKMEAARQLDSLASLGVGRSATELLGSDTSANQLSELANPGLPKTATDYLRELRAAKRLGALADMDPIARSIDPLGKATATSRLADLAFPKLPRTITDELRKIEAARRFDHLAGTVWPADDDPGSVAGGGGPEGKRKPGGSTKGKRPSTRVSKRSGSKK